MYEWNFLFVLIAEARKNVLELLESTTRGKLILAIFRKEGRIDYRLVTSLITDYEFDITQCYR